MNLNYLLFLEFLTSLLFFLTNNKVILSIHGRSQTHRTLRANPFNLRGLSGVFCGSGVHGRHHNRVEKRTAQAAPRSSFAFPVEDAARVFPVFRGIYCGLWVCCVRVDGFLALHPNLLARRALLRRLPISFGGLPWNHYWLGKWWKRCRVDTWIRDVL